VKELCRRCQGEVFEKIPLDDKGNIAIEAGSKVRFESEGDKKYFVCPHCGAKNILSAFTSKDGAPQMRIIRAE
jgi:hypothetical protein